MKIWHITKTIYGGSGQYALRLSESLNALGHQSTVFVESGPISTNVKQLSCQTKPIGKLFNRVTKAIFNRVALEPFHSSFRSSQWEIDKDEEPDIVHFHSLGGWVNFNNLSSLIPPQIPIFWTAHDLWMLSGGCVVYKGCDRYQQGCQICPSLKQPFSGWSRFEWQNKRRLIQDCRVVPIANSNWMANHILQSPFFSEQEEISVIPPIVSSEFFEKDSSASLQKKLGIPPSKIIIGLGARSVTDIHKGIPEFLQYFSQMSDLASRSTLIIFGDGMLDLPGNVDCRFLGALSEAKDLVNVYRSCNVFVSPSRMETFGMTLLESQAAGTPVVAFEVGGTSEAVCHRQYGWLAKLNDYESLFSGLRWLLGDPQKARNVGLQASKWVFENFSAPVVAKKQIDVYNSVTT